MTFSTMQKQTYYVLLYMCSSVCMTEYPVHFIQLLASLGLLVVHLTSGYVL